MSGAWVAIDFETANHDRGSVCSVGAVRVEDGRLVDRFTSLVRPPRGVGFFSPYNIAVHGITADDVAGAPEWPEVFERLLAFNRGAPLVAHNAVFDIGVLRTACGHTGLGWPDVDYACTLAVARRTWSVLPNHKLPTVCAHIGHQLRRHHSADADAEAAAHIMLAALRTHGATSLTGLGPMSRLAAGRGGAPSRPAAAPGGAGRAARYDQWQAEARAPLPEPVADADPAGPLYGRTVCVTGDLASMPKPEAWQRIAEAGGRPAKNVTKKTDILVIGRAELGGPTGKQRQAEAYREKGQAIELIGEAEFLAYLGLATEARPRA
ncbi:exonuclease domain-containing protein [Allonocardiopsis opalescens]|uniref:exonuclease domain-containing protein n=1 Tax=Allonocardiopsis opalescens TaxID=1144618 RepID=UPI000D063E78|nr:exonuclease domain-containing protein [Allonocardiopsis opalescens]